MTVMENHEKFHHPYQPYDIQLDFMKALYDCIEQGKVGIFESPTGRSLEQPCLCQHAIILISFQAPYVRPSCTIPNHSELDNVGQISESGLCIIDMATRS